MIEKILLSIKRLPPYPAVAQKVAMLLHDEDYSVAEVVNVIKYDQAIAANILKISNSAYFGVRQKIKSLHEAVVYLGQKNLFRALETAGARRIFSQSPAGYGMTPQELWKHSVSVALMSQILSRRIYERENPVLYTAALLHDVGKLVMGQYVQDCAQHIYAVMEREGCSFLEAEERIIGINHAELGGRIAMYWNFPPNIHDAIAYHHRPDLLVSEHNSLVAFVYIADQFCLMMGIDGGLDGLAHRGLTSIMRRYHLKESDLEESLLILSEEMARAQELFEMA